MSFKQVVGLFRGSLSLALALTAVGVVLAVVAVGIVNTHNQSKNQIRKNFTARGGTSAGFVSTYLSQQASRQERVATRYLADRRVTTARFENVVAAFGSDSAVLLDGSGRLLRVAPEAPALLGSRIAPRYAHLSAAVAGHVAVSGIVPSAVRHTPVVAVAVPYWTPHGRRVLSVAYPVAGSVLSAFVAHTIAAKPHLVLLVDDKGKLIAGDPHTSSATLGQRAPALAEALAHKSSGAARVDGADTTFVAAPVEGTRWRLVIAVPDERLFVSISGMNKWGPWVIFAVIAALAAIVLGLFARSIVAHERLEALSVALAEAAGTDVLTGLPNRRSLEEQMSNALSYAARRQEPLAVLMVDVDHFKQINDSGGHAAGDALLKAVADCMRAVFRSGDIFGRWGGDEFLAVLLDADEDGARIAGERLAEQAKAVDISAYGLSQPLTLSIGWASGYGVSPRELIIQADISLYRAKGDGRNRVVGQVLATH
ncbi:MAG TPA: diguanylate cyclase [Baekduia sp.]|nr:diguanylate cyclase [Baekduia sp.]